MRVTLIIILNILHTTHIIHIANIVLHIEHNILHIIYSYTIRPCKHGLDIKTSQNKGSTYGPLTRDPSLENTESASFIHTYFTLFRS